MEENGNSGDNSNTSDTSHDLNGYTPMSDADHFDYTPVSDADHYNPDDYYFESDTELVVTAPRLESEHTNYYGSTDYTGPRSWRGSWPENNFMDWTKTRSRSLFAQISISMAPYLYALSSIGQIPAPYNTFRMQKGGWEKILLGPKNTPSNIKIEKEGCKVVGVSQIISTILGRAITPDVVALEADKNGFLTQEAIVALMIANGINVKVDHWEKQLNAETLNNIRDGEGITFILGRAELGGGYGEHWVVITGYSVDTNGIINYTVNGTSENDEGRIYTSGDSSTVKEGKINRIETYTIRR